MNTVDHWRSQLEAWALPQDLLDAVPWNPYEWPAELFSRRDTSGTDQQRPERHTNVVIRRFEPGSLIDIGAGTGGSCLQFAAEGISVTAVEPDAGMAAKLRSLIADRDINIKVVEASWPGAAELVEPADVVTCSHVIHNVPEPGPFLKAMQTVASRAVVIQEFEVHPWAHLGPFYRELHGLDRPVGPTVDDLVAVIAESLGVAPTVERWNGGRPMWFADRDELMTFYGRRLLVPDDRRADLEVALGPFIVELGNGQVQLEDREKALATIWWRV